MPELAPLEVLAEAAANPEPSPRARALSLLVTLSPEPGGGDWGPRALWDPSPWVQRAGVTALGERLPEAAAAEQLEAYVRREEADPYVRAHAARQLGDAAGPELAEVLSAAWRAEDEPWRVAPLALAAASAGDAEAIAPLADALASGEIALEVDFVLAVGRSGLTELLPALREGLDNVEEELVLPYAVARVGLGDASGEQVLRKALSDADEELRLEALDYVSRMEHEAAGALLRRARATGPDLVRWYASLALAAREGDDLPLFDQAMVERDVEVRTLAVRFAAEAYTESLGSKRVAKVVRRVLRAGLVDDNALVRLAALRALAGLRLAGDEELLHDNLRHQQEAVRIEAAGALLAMAPPEE